MHPKILLHSKMIKEVSGADKTHNLFVRGTTIQTPQVLIRKIREERGQAHFSSDIFQQ